ncbi:MAG: hypothetical protein AW12_03089 [Candidatus Accumulibacter sp. BA-94]|nr:MAG: hypothetical protein AW12_03089 [Candidatus Accumulibacter sp. BA-94]
MDMRVEVEPTCVRVQNRDRPRRPLQLPVVLAEAQHRRPGTAHQRIEDDVGVRRGESAPLGRQREGQQEVVGRNQALHLTLQPLLALVVLAVRTKAMAAGVRNELVVGTVAALNLHHRAGRAAAIAQGREGTKLLEAQPAAKLCQEVRFELADDRAETDHRGVPSARR